MSTQWNRDTVALTAPLHDVQQHLGEAVTHAMRVIISEPADEMTVAPALKVNIHLPVQVAALLVGRVHGPVHQQVAVPTVELADIPHLLGQFLQ